MNHSILGRAALTAAVALGLGFGLQEAVASSPAESAAQRPYCEDEIDCKATCQLLYGPYAAGYCSPGNTCYCYF